MELVTGNGDVVVLSHEQLEGTVVNLGGIGVVTKLTLNISPTFQVQQDVYENLPFSKLEEHYEELTSDLYSVSLFTDWRTSTINQVWLKRQVPDGISVKAEPELWGAKLAANALHPIPNISAENCTEQMGIGGPWFERLPHFRMEFTPSSGEELQSEYFVPRQHAFAALCAIDQIRDHISPLLQISEVRTIAADHLWMSPCYKQDSVAIHFTWKQDWEGVRNVLPGIEKALAPFHARPHWAKLFTVSPEQLHSLYEKMPEFQQLLQRYDPQGKFHNEFLEKHIFGTLEA